MRKRFKIIYLIVLCSFAFTATAGSIMCACDMSDMQQIPVDKTSGNCHADKDTSLDEPVNDCCPDMNVCSGSTLFVSNASLLTIQTSYLAVQLSSNEHIVHNTHSPPTPPPKLIN